MRLNIMNVTCSKLNDEVILEYRGICSFTDKDRVAGLGASAILFINNETVREVYNKSGATSSHSGGVACFTQISKLHEKCIIGHSRASICMFSASLEILRASVCMFSASLVIIGHQFVVLPEGSNNPFVVAPFYVEFRAKVKILCLSASIFDMASTAVVEHNRRTHFDPKNLSVFWLKFFYDEDMDGTRSAMILSKIGIRSWLSTTTVKIIEKATGKFSDTVMSDSEDSTVTYTAVSSPFGGSLTGPPSPDYIPGPEEPQSPPPPDFVPELVYLEFMPPEDEILPTEEQPLPATDSPTADSPGYVPESDPEERLPEEDDDDPESILARLLADSRRRCDDEDEPC
ncbi:putative reverse transcriptase domain-containing protein [Tanacetum coccineum]